VTTPVRMLLRRMSNMVRSSIGSGIRQVEAFVHDRKIGNNVAEDGFAQGRPVLQRWIFYLAAREAIARQDANPMVDLSAPAFDVTESRAVRWQFADLDAHRARGQARGQFFNNRERLSHLVNAHLHAMFDISYVIYRRFYFHSIVGG